MQGREAKGKLFVLYTSMSPRCKEKLYEHLVLKGLKHELE